MAAGEDAAAAGMDVVPGSTPAKTIDTEINKTRDYIAQKIAAVAATVMSIWSVARGGTGATTASAARTNLAVPETAVAGLKFTSPGFGRISYEAPGVAFPTELAMFWQIAGKRDVNDGDFGGNAIYSTNVYGAPVTVGTYYAVYVQPDGRLGRTPSAKKYKKAINDYDGSVLGLRPVTYVLKADPDGTVRIGIIADEADGVEPLLVQSNGDTIEGFSYELLSVALLRDVQRLAARVDELERKAG